MKQEPGRAWKAVTGSVIGAIVLALFLPLMRSYETVPLPEGNGKVVVVGMVGVPWEVVDERTPHLHGLAASSAVANVSVRTFDVTTCAVSGWMTLNTGVRMRGIAGEDESCVESPYQLAGNPAQTIDHLDAWDDIVENNATNRFNPQLGLLAETLTSSGRSVAAVGSASAVAIADRHGAPLGPVIRLPMSGTVAQESAAAYREVRESDLVVVDLGSAHRDSTPASQLEMTFIPPGDVSVQTHALAARIDAELGALLPLIEPGTTLIVTSLGDADRETARLQIFLHTVIDDGEHGLATSTSTRQPGLVQNVDVQAAIFDALGMEVPAAATGAPPALVPGEATPAELADTNQRAMMTRAMVGLFYVLYVLGAVVIIAGVTITIRGGRFGFHHALSLLVSAAMPASSFLVNVLPWWRAGRFAAVSFTLLVTVIAMLITAFSVKLATDRRTAVKGLTDSALAPGAIALVTALTIGIDALVGSPLHSISVLGDQPQSGGRFYGISNAPFAIWAASMLMVAALCVRVAKTYRARLAVPAVIGGLAFVALYVDGAPHIGADFGGPPALILGFGVFAALVSGIRLTPVRLLAIGAAGAAGALAIAFLDWLRPAPERTHLGQFFESLLDGGAADVIARKADQLLTQIPWFGWLAAFAVLALLWWLVRRAGVGLARPRPEFPELRAGAIAVIVTLVSAMFINDSGLVIPLVGGLYATTLWLVAALPHLTTSERDSANDHA